MLNYECSLPGLIRVRVIRWDKLNSQFIITKFSILHVGGQSLFRFQNSRVAMLKFEITRALPTNLSTREGAAQGTIYLLYCI